jgi:hypothetical protein
MTTHEPGLHDNPLSSEPAEPESPRLPAPVRPRRHVPRWLWLVIVGSLGLVVGISAGASGSGGTKTVNVPGPTSTVTAPGPTVEVPGPTVKVPGPTVTKQVPVPGPTKTVPQQVPQTYTQLSSGTYVVGTDIQPGVYKTAGPSAGDSCYWAVLNSLDTNDIADNGNTEGPATIQVSGHALQLDGPCTWAKIG